MVKFTYKKTKKNMFFLINEKRETFIYRQKLLSFCTFVTFGKKVINTIIKDIFSNYNIYLQEKITQATICFLIIHENIKNIPNQF